jgi:hypothetical protein
MKKRDTARRELPRLVAGEVKIPEPPSAGTVTPEFTRLPKPGTLCPYTGLSRGAINELILPTKRNFHKPPVRSFCLRQRGAKTGVRLIDYASLRKHILANEDVAQCATA